MKCVLRLLQFCLISSLLVIFLGMAECGDVRKTNSGGDPNFISLKDGHGNYEAVIIDEQSKIEVKEISFSGTTKIGGILYEQYDAAGILEIEALVGKTIKILEDNYKSVRYPEKSLFKAKIIGEVAAGERKRISGLEEVEICGIDKKTGKTLFKADILDGKKVSVFQDAEISGIDTKTGQTLFNAKVVEVNTYSEAERKAFEEGKDILVPRDVVICGVDKKTGASMAWFMRKIDSIEFKKPESKDYPEAAIDVKFKTAVDKIKSKK